MAIYLENELVLLQGRLANLTTVKIDSTGKKERLKGFTSSHVCTLLTLLFPFQYGCICCPKIQRVNAGTSQMSSLSLSTLYLFPGIDLDLSFHVGNPTFPDPLSPLSKPAVDVSMDMTLIRPTRSQAKTRFLRIIFDSGICVTTETENPGSGESPFLHCIAFCPPPPLALFEQQWPISDDDVEKNVGNLRTSVTASAPPKAVSYPSALACRSTAIYLKRRGEQRA